MIKRTFKIINPECEKCGICKFSGIDRDEVYQSLYDAKLYISVNNEECSGMIRVEEEKSDS